MVSSDYYIADNSDLEAKKLDAAKEQYKAGEYDSALRLYLGLLNTSMSYRLYLQIGKCYYKLNKFDSAKNFFNKSISLEPANNPSFLYLGNMCYKNNDLKGAIHNWIHVYSYMPEDESVCRNLATSYFSLGMNFQSVFYYQKYLKYADSKTPSYKEIQTGINKCMEIGDNFFQKAKKSIALGKNYDAIEYLQAGVKNIPTSFDINYLLGSEYLEVKDYMHSLVYLKQAFSIDNYSTDVLQKLITVYLTLGDYTAAYCIMRRLLPRLIHNQSEYLKILKSIKELSSSFDKYSHLAHKDWGDRYFEDTNYHLALIEYENCIFINEDMQQELKERIELLKCFINPEPRIIEKAMTEGDKLYFKQLHKEANKYFSRVMLLSDNSSPEYKLAKSKISAG